MTGYAPGVRAGITRPTQSSLSTRTAHASPATRNRGRPGAATFDALWADGPPGDEALLARIAQGRAGLDAAFEPLVRVYQDRLYAFALRLCASRPDAEEIAQDAFVRAYQALVSYPPERVLALRLRPWLYQITLNLWRNHTRSRRRHNPPTDSLDAPRDYDGDGQTSPPTDPADDDASAQPEQAFDRAEQRAELGALVASLPTRYRAAVILRHIEGLSYIEMSETLAQPIGTIKANVHRGVAQLRAALATSPGAPTQRTASDPSPDPTTNTPCATLYREQEALSCH